MDVMKGAVVVLAAFWFFFNVAKATPDKTVLGGFCNGQVSDGINLYKDGVLDLLHGLIDDTPGSKGYDYYNKASDRDGVTSYGHAVCTETLTASECNSCLSSAAYWLWTGCSQSVGGRLQLRDCRVRFECYEFRNDV